MVPEGGARRRAQAHHRATAARAGAAERRDEPPSELARSVPIDESLPERYGDTLLIAQPRDPYWLHAYWEVTEGRWVSGRRLAGAGARWMLRVYELTAPAFSDRTIRGWFDILLTPEAADWHVEVRRPASWWCLELGWLGSDGRWVRIARSNLVETPSDRPSEEMDDAWGAPGEAFARQYHSPSVSSPGSPWWVPGRLAP